MMAQLPPAVRAPLWRTLRARRLSEYPQAGTTPEAGSFNINCASHTSSTQYMQHMQAVQYTQYAAK